MREDKIIKKLIEHDEQLELIKERLAKTATTDEINEKHDQVLTILRKLDHERVLLLNKIYPIPEPFP